MDKNEAARRNDRDQVGERARHRTVFGRFEGEKAVFSDFVSAFVRAGLVAGLVMTPALLLPSVAADTAQIVVVISLLSALLTFMEYFGRYPSIVEFRFAAPFNRLKFICLGTCVLVMSLILRGQTDPSDLSIFLTAVGEGLGHIVDFPFSPVRLVVLMLPYDASAQLIMDVRTAAGVAYMVSMTMIVSFMIMMWVFNWPMGRGKFNVWLNLPLFDPTRGGDIVERLRRDAGFNLVLGILAPFIIPTMIKAASDVMGVVSFDNGQTMIWMMTAWAFLPASMFIRGLALMRVADLIEAKRKKVSARGDAKAFQKA
ncbi:MAG: hypothetical protein AAFV74_19155 [Pseudomonadota bacterium]